MRLLLAILLAALVGCGSKTEPAPSSSDGGAPKLPDKPQSAPAL